MDDGLNTIPSVVYGRINKPKQIGNVTFEAGVAAFRDGRLVAIVEHKESFLQIWSIGPLNGQLSILTSYATIYWDQTKDFIENYL